MAATHVCRSCGAIFPKKLSPGRFAIELLLSALAAGSHLQEPATDDAGMECSKCGSKEIIPVDTPEGRAIVAKYRG